MVTIVGVGLLAGRCRFNQTVVPARIRALVSRKIFVYDGGSSLDYRSMPRAKSSYLLLLGGCELNGLSRNTAQEDYVLGKKLGRSEQVGRQINGVGWRAAQRCQSPLSTGGHDNHSFDGRLLRTRISKHYISQHLTEQLLTAVIRRCCDSGHWQTEQIQGMTKNGKKEGINRVRGRRSKIRRRRERSILRF